MACGTIAALGLGAAGAGTNIYAGEKERSAMNALTTQEAQRTQGYRNQAQGVFNNSLNKSSTGAAQQQIQEGQNQLANLQSGAQGVPIGLSMPSFGGAANQQNQARTQLTNKAASNYGGMGNYGFQQGLKDEQANNQLGTINSNAQGWANILPTRLQQASQSQGGLHALGDLLGMAGMLTGIGSMAAAPAAAGRATISSLPGLATPTVLNGSPFLYDPSWLAGLGRL